MPKGNTPVKSAGSQTPRACPSKHKFRLGTDLPEAKRREQRLRELWEKIKATAGQTKPLWDEGTLEIARQISRGAHQILLSPLAEESDANYAQRLDRTQRRFPFLQLKAQDLAKYAAGSGRETYTIADLLIWPASPREEFERNNRYAAIQPLGVFGPPAGSAPSLPEAATTSSPQSLHQAMGD